MPTKSTTEKSASKKPVTEKKVTKKTASSKSAAPKKAPSKKAPSTKTEGATLAVGDRAPAFSLAGDDGATHALADHRGHYVVLYFYPKDSTPGCTTEAQSFRDASAELAEVGAVVYGVSKDSIASHQKFRDKHALDFTLLSDPEGTTIAAYGAWGEKSLYGRVFDGILRQTFVIGPDGHIAAHYEKVKVAGHGAEVAAAIRALRHGG